MILKDIEVQRSKVYICTGKHTYTYGIGLLDMYGECEVIKVHVVTGKVYIEIKECK